MVESSQQFLHIIILEEFLMSDGTSGAFGGYFGVPACAASNTAANLGLINSLPPGFSFAAPGTAPSGANSVLGPYLPHTCDGYQFQSRIKMMYPLS